MDNEKLAIEIAFKYLVTISIVALVTICIVASVALISMEIQSSHAMSSGVQAFETYMNADYDYGQITQTTTIGE